MIDIQQLTSLISAFRVETEKESISPETVGSILQAIADLLATAQGVATTGRWSLLRGRIVPVLPRNLRLSESNANFI